MQANELRALLTKTSEVAIRPMHVEVQVENRRDKRTKAIYCPTGLIKAKVLVNGQPWTERRIIAACGDQEYIIERKNGVLVEIDLDDLDKETLKIKRGKVYMADGKNPYPHTAVVKRDGKEFIHMVTSRSAIFASWGEYALEIAKRQKQTDEAQAREDALRNPQAAIMGMTREEFDKRHVNSSEDRFIYLTTTWNEIPKRDAKGKTIYETVVLDGGWKRERAVVDHEIGKFEITLEQAKKILNLLTDEQKASL